MLLDELNLAGQSVLEGLNAVLDHRAEVFIPELGQTFQCPPSFHLFAAQNPLQEGGGRKGLPKSFLNRFSRVHIQLLQSQDLLFIAGEASQLVRSCTAVGKADLLMSYWPWATLVDQTRSMLNILFNKKFKVNDKEPLLPCSSCVCSRSNLELLVSEEVLVMSPTSKICLCLYIPRYSMRCSRVQRAIPYTAL